MIRAESEIKEEIITMGEKYHGNLMGESRSDKRSELGTASIPNSDPSRAPLMEISNQRITD